MKEIRLSEIIIPGLFRHSTPKKEKMFKIRRYVKYFGKVDKPVILNGKILVDGYIRYLVALEFGMDTVPFIRTLDSEKVRCDRKEKFSLITGRDIDSQNECIFKNDKYIQISIGDKLLVDNEIIIVTGVYESDNLPMFGSVIRKIG